MINWKKISKPVLTVTMLGATAFYGGSAIGQSRLGYSSQELSVDTATVTLVTDACSAAQDSTAAAKKSYETAEANAGSTTNAVVSASIDLHDLQDRKAPAATKEELDAAVAKGRAALAADDKTQKAQDDALNALNAAIAAQESACAAGPGYLPNTDVPDHPIIQTMPTPKPKSSGGSS
jgi:hypothetical protein